jgi:hypothetical protein
LSARLKRAPMKPAAASAAQNLRGLSLYSALSTGLPAAMYGSKSPHSWYWLHCSVMAPSN